MASSNHPYSKSVLDVLKAVPDARKFIADELHDMALGNKEYHEMHSCGCMPPWSRQIWLAAAELLLSEGKI